MGDHTREKSKKPKNRGNLHQFFDAAVNENIYGQHHKKRPATAPKAPVETKKSALVFTTGGRFEIDRKVLVEECAADFDRAWFFNNASRAITHRWDSSFTKVFNPKSLDALQLTKPTHDPATDKQDLLTQLSLQINEEDNNTKIHNSQFQDGDVKVVKEPVRKPNDREVEELFHNASTNNSIDTFVKRKYVSMRTNQNLGVNSPDIILFKECLRKNVLPPGTLDLQKSTDLELNNSYDPSVSTRQLAVMTSTLMGKSVGFAGSASAELGMSNSYASIPEDGPYQQPPSSTLSIGSMDSGDIIGIENEQVISINLNNRGIGNDRGICLSAALSYCPHLCVIKLSNNRLSDRSLSMILKAVFNISYCEELDVSCNAVGDLSTACLAEYLQVSHCALRRLNVRRCTIDDDNCIALCRSLHHNESLESLDLSENLSIQDEFSVAHGDHPSGGAAIAELLAQNCCLQELRCASNNLRKQCVLLLAEKLALNTSLRLLDLSRNDIADHEGRHIGRALHSHRTLTYLDMSANMISSKGAISIAYAVQQPDSAVQYVNLNGNTIGKLGGVYMLRAMRAVAAYPDMGHHKHARHFAMDHDHETSQNAATPSPTRRMLTIDYKVTVMPNRDENIFDVLKPLKHYEFNLADPYDYTIARMLVDIADRHPNAHFKTLKYLQPGSHLWEYVHLGRGGLFELPVEYGLTSQQVWSEHAQEINAAVDTILAAKIAEMQVHSSGTKEADGRRRAFRANATATEAGGMTANERLGSVLTTNRNTGESEAAKHMRHKTRSARHALYRIGAKLGFSFPEEILHGIIEKLCKAPVEARTKLVTLLEIIFQEVASAIIASQPTQSRKGQPEVSAMTLPMKLVAQHIEIFGIHKDTDLEGDIPAVLRVRRFISETDLAEDKTRLNSRWYMQFMLSRQVDILPPTSRTYWAALNTSHPWAVPTSGLLHLELDHPHLPPTIHQVLSNESVTALLQQVTGGDDSQRALDQIEQILLGTSNELFLTCIQAEVVLLRFAKFRTHSHFSLVESLCYQMVSPMEVRRFIVRNLYFSEILTLRRKLNYMFKVLTGNVTGHYALDLRNAQHRDVAVRIAQMNNFHATQVLKREVNASQCGSGDSFRNASFNTAYVQLNSAWFNELPEIGKLCFDYVSPMRCPEGMPPSAGTWGCSCEGYTDGGAAPVDDDGSLDGDNEGEEDLGVYDDVVEHNGNFSSLHAKEQFVQELVENLFAKKFEPRSKALRKETRMCPKNCNPVVKRKARGGYANKTPDMFIHVIRKETRKAKPRPGYVEKMKAILASTAGQDDSTQDSPGGYSLAKSGGGLSSSSSDSSGDEFGLEKDSVQGLEPGQIVPADNPASPKRGGRLKLSAMAPAAPVVAGKVKVKRERPLNKFKENYLSEATEYWKDTAETSWLRCRSNHLDQLRKKLADIVQDETKEKSVDKDNGVIPSWAYLNQEYVALRNVAIFKSIGLGGPKRSRRPNSAIALPLNYSLNQTAMWGGVSGSKKYFVPVENATQDDIAAAAVEASATSGKYPAAMAAGASGGVSTKAGRRVSMKMKSEKMNNSALLAQIAAGNAPGDESGTAAVASKLAFEKFLLRLEVVMLYNTWLTVDQVNVILQELLAHSSSASVVVRSLCVLYNCMVDRTPYYSLLHACSDQLRNELVHRLGILNVWSPAAPDGRFELDLAAHDHREACKLMCVLVLETANKPGRHEMIDVVFYKESLLEAPIYLTCRSSSRNAVSFANRTGSSSPGPLTGTAAEDGRDHLPVTWLPPELWTKASPGGPPLFGHIQFTIRTVTAPAYCVV